MLVAGILSIGVGGIVLVMKKGNWVQKEAQIALRAQEIHDGKFESLLTK